MLFEFVPALDECVCAGIPLEFRKKAWPLLLSMRAPLAPSATECVGIRMHAVPTLLAPHVLCVYLHFLA